MAIGTIWNSINTVPAGAIRSSMKRSFSPSRLISGSRPATWSDRGASFRAIGRPLLRHGRVVQRLDAVLEHLGNGLARPGQGFDGDVRISLVQLRPVGEVVGGVHVLALEHRGLQLAEHRVLLLERGP